MKTQTASQKKSPHRANGKGNNSLTVLSREKESEADNAGNPFALIQLAVQNNADITQIEKLMELQKRWDDRQGEKAYNTAMANFQRQCPVIKKKTVVRNREDKGGGVRYRYATIDHIISQTGKLIADNGLFYHFTTSYENDFLTVTCHVTHLLGHTKPTDFKVPIGKEDHMSDVQKYGARVTFASRYAFCNAFGIRTADEDTDAIIGEEKKKNLFPDADKKTIAEELLLMNTEKEVFDYVVKWGQYKNIQEFKNMIRVRIANLPLKDRMTELERTAYKAASKVELP